MKRPERLYMPIKARQLRLKSWNVKMESSFLWYAQIFFVQLITTKLNTITGIYNCICLMTFVDLTIWT
jgi:hypothetical protein